MLIILVVIAIILVTKYNNNNDYHNNEPYWQRDYQQPEYTQQQTTYQDPNEPDWTQCYQRTKLLTKNEYNEYKKLKYYADKYNFLICPKVRLLDIIVPREGPNNLAALGKIKSKHVDFVICDSNLNIKGIVELDDNSHKRPDRIERDKFVDSVLKSVGYKVVHTYSVNEGTLRNFYNN